MKAASHYHQGKYEPKNKSKYIGKKIPEYRSGWEKQLCVNFDDSPYVIEWASEPFAIQYKFIDLERGCEKWSIYVPDFYAKMETNRGNVRFLIEVKPYAQTVEPNPPKKNTQAGRRRYDAAFVRSPFRETDSTKHDEALLRNGVPTYTGAVRDGIGRDRH